MVDSAQQRGRIWRAPLALTFLLASVVVAIRSQAQTFEVLHTFHSGEGPQSPWGKLLRDAAGNLLRNNGNRWQRKVLFQTPRAEPCSR